MSSRVRTLALPLMNTTGKQKRSEKGKGGRRGWATSEQEAWLKDRISRYADAQGQTGKANKGRIRALGDFWPPLWEGWFEKWPLPELTEAQREAGVTVDTLMKEIKRVSGAFHG